MFFSQMKISFRLLIKMAFKFGDIGNWRVAAQGRKGWIRIFNK